MNDDIGATPNDMQRLSMAINKEQRGTVHYDGRKPFKLFGVSFSVSRALATSKDHFVSLGQ